MWPCFCTMVAICKYYTSLANSIQSFLCCSLQLLLVSDQIQMSICKNQIKLAINSQTKDQRLNTISWACVLAQIKRANLDVTKIIATDKPSPRLN